MNDRRRLVTAVFLLTLPFAAIHAQDDLAIDRTELEQIGDADIDFENYEGPVERMETREQIRGIGRYLGERVTEGRSADYYGRYSLTRIIGEVEGARRAADLIELSPRARVDHIVNLRRIVAGYLEQSWEYGSSDADFLARIITIYNAVHRGNLSFFAERYRRAVVEALDAERVGLAVSYREWPGRTQLLVPIRVDRGPGDLDVVDSSPLIDEAVIAELRARRDLGVEERKAIIEFVERVIEERTEAIVEEREQIAEERDEIAERRQEIEVEIEAVIENEESASEQPAVQPREEPQEETSPSAVVEREPEPPVEPREEATAESAPQERSEERAALEEELTELDEREAELDEREAELEQEAEEVSQLEERLEEIYEDTAEDQAALESGEIPAARTLFPVRRPSGGYDITVFETGELGAVGEQTIPTDRPDLVAFQGSILAVDSRASRLLMLDPRSLELLEESDATVYRGADVVVVENAILTIVEIDGAHYVGEFDARLVLVRRSRVEVIADTEIVPYEGGVLVQAADRTVVSLDRREFE